jgi:DNA repair protein RadC
MAPTNTSKAHLEGHRDRLRARFVKTGEDGLADHEMLELLLFGVIQRRDTKEIARALLARFRSLTGVSGAPLHDLMQVPGVGEAVAIHLKAVHALLVRTVREEVTAQPVLSSWSSVLNYLKLRLEGATREEFRVLFMDKRHRLIADEKMGDGTVDQAPVYPREIARRALELSASSVILSHNHPSGDPSPSGSDVAMTRDVINALKPLSVSVIDHIVVGRDGTRSLKALGLI